MQAIVFDPLLPLALIAALAGVALVGVVAALWRGLTGWWLRGLAALVLLAALAGPSLRQEDRAPVPNIAIVVLDDSTSNRIDDRGAQLAAALEGLEAELGRLGETEGLEVHDGPCRRPRRGRHAARLGARRGHRRAAGGPHRRGDPRHRRAGARRGGARWLPRAGAGAADRQRRRLGPPGGGRDRAGLRDRRRAGQPVAPGRGPRRGAGRRRLRAAA